MTDQEREERRETATKIRQDIIAHKRAKLSGKWYDIEPCEGGVRFAVRGQVKRYYSLFDLFYSFCYFEDDNETLWAAVPSHYSVPFSPVIFK